MKNVGGVLIAAMVIVVFKMPIVNAAEQLDYTMAGGNSCNGNYIDITAKERVVKLSALGLHLSPGRHRLQFYVTRGSYVGRQTRSDAWQLFDQKQALSNGEDRLTRVPLKELSIQPHETVGLMIVSSHTLYYTNRGDTEPMVENTDLRLFSSDSVCGEAFIGTVTDRVWNGAVYYNDSFCFPLIPEQGKTINLCL